MTRRSPLASCGEAQPRRAREDQGSAIIEFVFVAVVVMVPLLYLLTAVATVQRSRLSVTNAARDVGRAIASAPAGTDLAELARSALRIALEGGNVSTSGIELRYVAPDASCDAAAIVPDLSAGSEFQCA